MCACAFLCLQESGTVNGRNKGSKMVKDKANPKGTAPFTRSQRPVLSQSLSFPARGADADHLKKSVDGHPLKSNAKQARVNGVKTQGPSSNGTVTSVSRLSHPNRRASTGVESKEVNTNGGVSARRTTSASVSSIHKTAVSFHVIISSIQLFPLTF